MDQKECENWIAVTASSSYKWVEDRISYLNGRGSLYYTGGEDGVYIQISNDGTLKIGTYEGAFPHIGEALFKVKEEQKYADFNEAFQMACKIGGRKFLKDLIMADQVTQKAIRSNSSHKSEFIISM
ncbi:hypothetical protein DSECCO2_556850 [anaerobic digester metagenome]